MTSQSSSQSNNDISVGNVYIMTHSLFSNVIRIGCTPQNTTEYAKQLSDNAPGEYTLVYSLKCDNPCHVKKQIREYLNAKNYVNEFYEVTPDVAKKLMERETMKIPIFNTL